VLRAATFIPVDTALASASFAVAVFELPSNWKSTTRLPSVMLRTSTCDVFVMLRAAARVDRTTAANAVRLLSSTAPHIVPLKVVRTDVVGGEIGTGNPVDGGVGVVVGGLKSVQLAVGSKEPLSDTGISLQVSATHDSVRFVQL
jgi:hypothetical protein